MARKDDDFLLVEEKSNTGKYLVICGVIAILGFGGYAALMNLNKTPSPNQPESSQATEESEENKAIPPTDITSPGKMGKATEKIVVTGGSVKATINFAYDSSIISETEKSVLQEFVRRVKEGKGQIKVEGYADSNGTTAYNKALSAARANEATDMLKKLGLVDKVNVSTQGLGMDKPVANNDSEEGRAKNRRVEIVFVPAT